MAVWLRGGMRPQAYVYPAEMRATRDLRRRRMPLMRKRAQWLAHIQNTNRQSILYAAFDKTFFSILWGASAGPPSGELRGTCEIARSTAVLTHLDAPLMRVEYMSRSLAERFRCQDRTSSIDIAS
jgi:hypothetical protein